MPQFSDPGLPDQVILGAPRTFELGRFGEVVMRCMRVLATLHRWWGVAFCLLFAMWFASGHRHALRAVPGAEREAGDA